MCNLLWRHKYYLVFFLILTDIHQTKNYSLLNSLNMIYLLTCTALMLRSVPVGSVMCCCAERSPSKNRQSETQSNQWRIFIAVHWLRTKKQNFKIQVQITLLWKCQSSTVLPKIIPKFCTIWKSVRRCFFYCVLQDYLVSALLCITLRNGICVSSPPLVCWHSIGSTPGRRYSSWLW